MHSDDHFKRRVSIWIIAFTAIVIGILVYIAHNKTANCKRTMSLMHLYILEHDQAVGTPGSPLYAYYVTHPNAIKLAHKQNQYFLAQFNEIQCH